ncbi:MAG: NAD(P)-binding protein [Thermoanaerobaculia bacterium]
MTEKCEVCIVGAGISGLNALFVASRYLSRDQKVVLVDRRSRAGGMWIDTYDYVRLHQPHPFFTAGRIEWTLGKEREHLANKDEVLGHLRHCLEEIKRRVRVTELFGYEFENAEEVGGMVRITCRGGAEVVLRSRAMMPFKPDSWVINCTGSLIRGNHPYEPYTSASGRILSVQNRSVTIPFPTGGAAAYFLTHLLFLGKLLQVPLYAMDAEELRRKAPQYVMAAATGPLHLYNLSLIAEALPAWRFTRVVSQYGLDLDRWFPLPRRLRASAGFMLTHKRDRKYYRRALDTVADRFGVRCGPVVGAGRA